MGSFVRVALKSEQLPKPGHQRCVQGPRKPTTTSGAWDRPYLGTHLSSGAKGRRGRLCRTRTSSGTSSEPRRPLYKRSIVFGVRVPNARCGKAVTSGLFNFKDLFSVVRHESEFWNIS